MLHTMRRKGGFPHVRVSSEAVLAEHELCQGLETSHALPAFFPRFSASADVRPPVARAIYEPDLIHKKPPVHGVCIFRKTCSSFAHTHGCRLACWTDPMLWFGGKSCMAMAP